MSDIFSLTELSRAKDANKSVLTLGNFASSLTQVKNERELLDVNEKIGEYGLTLTPQEAREIIEAQHKALSANDRVDIGAGAVVKIAEKFAQSGFIERDCFAGEITELVDLFYYIKTEVRDSVSDDALIEAMYEFYTEKCGGSFDLLAGRETDFILRYFNRGKDDILTLDEDDDYTIPVLDEDGDDGDEPDLD